MDGNIERQRAYQVALQSSEVLEVVLVSRDVLIEAARLRAVSNLRLPDAIHGATTPQTIPKISTRRHQQTTSNTLTPSL